MNVSVFAYPRPHASSEAELRCANLIGTRQCSRLIGVIYQGTVGDLGLYCGRCKAHYRVGVDFSTGRTFGRSLIGPAASLAAVL